jgi:hypothetical protein
VSIPERFKAGRLALFAAVSSTTTNPERTCRQENFLSFFAASEEVDGRDENSHFAILIPNEVGARFLLENSPSILDA